MICFYHSADLDGHCSGAIVKKVNPDCEMRGLNYGDEFPWKDVEGQDVIMVDVCLQPFSEHMPRLLEVSKSLVWIDHHKTEMDEYAEWSVEPGTVSDRRIDGYRQVDKSACELAWRFYWPGISEPDAVYLLGRYDVWDHKDKRVMPYQWGFRMFDNTYPESEIWGDCLDFAPEINEFNDRVIMRGEVILKFRDSENAKYVSAFAFETKFEGLRCICINRGMTNSQMFDSIWDPEKYDAMLTFVWKKGQWTVSLYGTKDIDLSAIAKKHGGGGHKQACGFQCKELPFHYVGKNFLSEGLARAFLRSIGLDDTKDFEFEKK